MISMFNSSENYYLTLAFQISILKPTGDPSNQVGIISIKFDFIYKEYRIDGIQRLA